MDQMNFGLISLILSLLLSIYNFFGGGNIPRVNFRNDPLKPSYSYSSPYSYYDSLPKTQEERAVDRARSYLRSSAFSYEGLIEQLEYSGYSHNQAVYGVDHCGADWYAQALEKAQSYLRSSAFSYEGLIEQLEYSGFTHDQAVYGANHCNADWKEQAVKKANSYLRSFDFSYSELIDQLEYSGFTYQEAKYGADHCNAH